jgi:hypothetical protein
MQMDGLKLFRRRSDVDLPKVQIDRRLQSLAGGRVTGRFRQHVEPSAHTRPEARQTLCLIRDQAKPQAMARVAFAPSGSPRLVVYVPSA